MDLLLCAVEVISGAVAYLLLVVYLLIVALLVILCIVGITLFTVHHSLFAVVNLLRAAVIFSNKHTTITPVNCICRDQVGKIGTKIRNQNKIV